jgi:hypothetical protein
MARPEAIREAIPPNHCRLIGTVLKVHEVESALNSDDPCSRFPCTATVRVDSIVGYGSAFGGALGIGQEIEVQFLYTLAPSEEAYPSESFSLPGLGDGDRFGADLRGAQETMLLGAGKEESRYAVALYKVIR